MKLTWEPYTLNLRVTWRIAHGASDQRHNVFAYLGQGEEAGNGEAAGVPHHGETQQGILTYLESVADRVWDPFQIEDLLNGLPPGSAAARCAIDLALHDALGKRLGQPVYRLFGLNPARAPETSYTISIDEPAVMAELAAIRQVHTGPLRVDANAGWSRERAAAVIPQLAQFGLEFVEQPLPVGDIEGLRWLRAQKLGVPIFADENILTSRDVAAHAGAVDGVVIKIAKTGGLREALRAIHTARALDMQIMLGSMVETSLAVTAAAHLSPLVDYADLDGPLMISNDPFDGMRYDKARLVLPERPGLGVVRKPAPTG
jgi:L-alanine-DL-glutamate epimerase-like enolase superfamily enzyme